MSRPDLDEYFMGFARHAGTRATCDRGKSGAVLVRDGQVLSTGYVGAAKGLDHCDEAGHLFRNVEYLDELEDLVEDSAVAHVESKTHPIRQHCVRTAHAEGNALIQAAKHGIATNGATLYCKMEPCLRCCNDIINAGIVRVVAEFEYHGARLTREWFRTAGVDLKVMNAEMADYGGPEVTSGYIKIEDMTGQGIEEEVPVPVLEEEKEEPRIKEEPVEGKTANLEGQAECPACQGKEVTIEQHDSDKFYVMCTSESCHVSAPYGNNLVAAIEKWNAMPRDAVLHSREPHNPVPGNCTFCKGSGVDRVQIEANGPGSLTYLCKHCGGSGSVGTR